MSHAVDIHYKENNMTYIKKTLYGAFALLAGGSAIAAGETVAPLIEYADTDALVNTISGLQTLAISIGAAFVLLAVTRMLYRKIRGIVS